MTPATRAAALAAAIQAAERTHAVRPDEARATLERLLWEARGIQDRWIGEAVAEGRGRVAQARETKRPRNRRPWPANGEARSGDGPVRRG